MNAPPHNMPQLLQHLTYDPIDVVCERDGRRNLVQMAGLVPSWWNKTLKDVKMAAFKPRAETV